MIKRSQDPGLAPAGAPMEQVRELLFGAQLKDVETRFQRQEERFQREIADVHESVKSRLDSLENFMKSEISSLLHRLQEEQSERESLVKNEQRERTEAVKAEQRERMEALTQLAKDLAAAVESFDRRNAKLAASLDTTERELRSLLMAESGALSTKVEDRYQDALNVLSSTASQIRHDMVHRTALSGMFTDLAVKLSGQWTLDMGQIITGEGLEDKPEEA
ncbi:MAG: hypothetical protein LBO77_00515 [Desulfovibrio sp.]|jgi:chromosome segregation ATPase|nr:hypothetical protein [Desulfovibrio sp.]